MGLIAAAKGKLVETIVDKLTDGNHGSTMLGAAAMGVMAMNVNFGDLFNSGDQMKQAHAIGLVVAGVLVGIWGFFVGRKKQPKIEGSQN